MSKQETDLDLTDFEILQLAATLSAGIITSESGYTAKSASSLMLACAEEIEAQLQEKAAASQKKKQAEEIKRFQAAVAKRTPK